jgi:NAD(P)-dependent dehydrogenase (short-subunit alcohol dehydrogenase family)
LSSDRYFVGRPRGNRVAGKIAIVTGAGSGIGRAMAELLALEGAKVVVANRNVERGEETVRHLREAGGEGLYLATDLTQEAECIRLVQRTVESYGRLDVLVNNAGIYPRASLTETTVAFWREIMRTNLEAPFVLCREAVPHMIRGGGGSIVNVGSANGLAGGANLTAYSTSKGGLLTLTRNIAAAYARDYIRANYLIPGWILTDQEYVIQAKEGHDAAWLEANRANLPTGRYAIPEDSAYAVLYLASDEAWHVNGTILNTDGGQSTVPGARRRVT